MRSLSVICQDICEHWRKSNGELNIHPWAWPYFIAMQSVASTCEANGLDDTKTPYYDDDIRSVVAYFLSNATSFRGEHARRIKAELKRKYGIK